MNVRHVLSGNVYRYFDKSYTCTMQVVAICAIFSSELIYRYHYFDKSYTCMKFGFLIDALKRQGYMFSCYTHYFDKSYTLCFGIFCSNIIPGKCFAV